tara:strand:- start:1374 stop:3527 length:2154 start_codon:yes stop_codon:yes gene_type:complete
MTPLPVVEGSPRVRRVLLVGNPNAGKTSLFNALTGLRAKTANYPGITVDLRKATIPLPRHGSPAADPSSATNVELIDLPGLYGMEATSPEEQLAAQSIRGDLEDESDATILVLDATNLARNLFLAEEVLQYPRPALIALTMSDIARQQGIMVDSQKLSKRLQCPVVAVSSRTGEGLNVLLDQLTTLLSEDHAPEPPLRQSCTVGCSGCTFAARHNWADDVTCESVSGGESQGETAERLDRWLTSPVIGTCALVAVMMSVFFAIFSLADIPMSLIEEGFGWISGRVDSVIPETRMTPWAWVPLVAGLAMSVFALGYRVGEVSWSKTSTVIAVAVSVATALIPIDDFRSLVIDGVIGGIAGVVVFLPQICILFFFIAILEDTGYLARAAFVMERWMRYVGLPGKAFVPMLSAHACAIPGIMATRTIENWRDRLVTILVLPLLTCSARLPVYAMMSALLFAGRPLYAALTFAFAYALGLAAALGSAFVLKRTILPGEAAPLVIELPPYRIPSLRNALLSSADRASAFLRTAGSVILLISVVLWALATYPKLSETRQHEIVQAASVTGASDEAIEYAVAQQSLENSFAGRIGKSLEPVFSPLGFDWKINVGVVSSFAAREVLVSTLSVIYGVGEEGGEDQAGLVETLRRQTKSDGTPVFSTATSLSLLVFYVLAMQCLPTQAVTRRETGRWGWAIFQFAFMTLLAYGSALLTFQVLSRMTA